MGALSEDLLSPVASHVYEWLKRKQLSAFHARPLCIVYHNVCVIVCIVLLCVSVFYVLSSPSFHPLLMPGNNM